MTNYDTLRVDLGPRSYDILVGSNLLANTASHIAPFVRKAGVIVISDATVAGKHLPTVLASLDSAGIAHRQVIVPAINSDHRIGRWRGGRFGGICGGIAFARA